MIERAVSAVLPYVDDSALWPVTFAVMGHVAIVLVTAVLWVWRSPSPLAVGVLAGLVVATLQVGRTEAKVRGRVGALSASLLLTWFASVGLAVLCQRTGVF